MAKPQVVSFAPLEEAAKRIADLPDHQPGDGFDPDKQTFNDVFFAEMVGASPRSIKRWRSVGEVPWISADQMAVALGLHPVLVWGQEWLDLDADYVQTQIAKEMRKLGTSARQPAQAHS